MKTIIVFKTHVDIGFTDLSENVLRKYAKDLLSKTISTCEETQSLGEDKRFVWTMSSYMTQYSLKHCLPEMRERASNLATFGQLAWHALPFTTHTEFCGLEEFIRGIMISRNLSENYGHWPISAKMTDVPGHSWILPSILAKAGIKFLHLGSNPSVNTPKVPRLFWWEGPDGSRVLTFYSKGLYGSSLEAPKDWPYPVWLALLHTNDNEGPQSAVYVKELFDKMEEMAPDTEAMVGTLDDFYNALIQCPLDIPVIKKDLADTWIHGTGTYPRETALLRDLRGQMTEYEKLLTAGVALGFVDEALIGKEALDKAYEQCILYGEHTWGMDIKTVLGWGRRYDKEGFRQQKDTPKYLKAERSWDEQRERYEIAAYETAKVKEFLGKHENCDKVLVFNGLGWERDGLPSLGYAIRDKNQRLAVQDDTLVCDASKGLLENKWFKIKIDKLTGSIASLFEKEKDKEWVEQNNNYGFGHYRYDIYGTDDITDFVRSYTYRFFDWSVNDLGRMNYPEHPHLTFYKQHFTIEAKRERGCASLTIKGDFEDCRVKEFGDIEGLVFRVIVYDNEPVIDLRFKLIQKDESPMVEAGHFVFPLNLDGARVEVNKTGSVVNIEEDIIKGANNALHCLEYFVDVTNGNNGMAFLSRHIHLVSVGSQNILKYKPAFEEVEPTLYFNAFNNSYGTNFPQWMSGSYEFEFRLIPHSGDWKSANIYHKAIEYMLPVITIPAPDALMADECSLVEGLDGMSILCFKLAEKGDGFILRVHDITGTSHETSISFHDSFSQISLCDLQERETTRLTGHKYTFTTQPFEIHTFYIKK